MRPLPAIDAHQISVGDKIKIMRNDNTDITFKVSAVSDEGISGARDFVAYSDIRQVHVSHFSTGKTVGLAVLIVVVVAAVDCRGGCGFGYGPAGGFF